MKKSDLRKVNEALYRALSKLLMLHPNNEGNIQFTEKEYNFISNDLDLIEIKYLGWEPNDTNTNRISKYGRPVLTDI